MAATPQVCFFLGANTPSGFYSLYDQLLPPTGAEDCFLLKGGPGCGKSTLMRRVAQAVEARGLTVEYVRCSGDPDSLDAIWIPALRAAIADATAPHVMEPQCPGAVERYVDLGACYDIPALKAIRSELTACRAGYPECYRRAYRCLTAAAEIRGNIRALLLTPALEERMVKRARGILSRECRRSGKEPGHVTRRFLDAVSCQGVRCEFGTAEVLCRRVYELCDTYGLAHPLLARLCAGAVAAGYDVIACPDPLDPERLRHLFVPALELGFLSSTPDLPYSGGRPYRRLRLDAMADPDLLRQNRGRLRFSRKVAGALVEEAVDAMAQAKDIHDRLEALYNPHVDFDRVHTIADTISDELLARN